MDIGNILKVKVLAFFAVLSICFNSFGQQPSHFIIGDDVFANSHVYSLLIHSENLLYASTNYGLFSYRNGNFQEISPAPEQLGSSLFSLVENKKGEVFCCNLAGQIFKVTDDGLELFSKVPEQYIGDGMEMVFNAQDNLIVSSKVYLRYDSNTWKLIHDPGVNSTISINGFYPNRILIPKYSSTEMLSLHGDSIEVLSIDSKFSNDVYGYHQFPAYLNNSLVSLYNSGLFVNHNKVVSNESELSNIRSFRQLDDNEILGLNKTNGFRRIQLQNGELKISNSLMSDYFISACTKSINGTLFLGTFNHGVIVVPNMSSITLSNPSNYFTGICSSPEGIIAIEREGSIYDVSASGVKLFNEDCAFSRGKVIYVPGVDFNVLPDRKSLLFDAIHLGISGRLGLVKSATLVDSTTALVATSHGVFRRGGGVDQFNWIPASFDSQWSRISSKNFRCKAITYDVKNGALYYSTHEGLVCVNKNGESKNILFNGIPIDCNHLVYDQGAIWCASQALGILKVMNGKVVSQINEANGLASNYTRKIQLHDRKLYVSHKTGFQIMDLETSEWKSIGNAEGITNGSINDFSVFQGSLWIVSNGQIISLPLNQVKKKPDFSLVISYVQLGDSVLSPKIKSNLSYDQNHFVVRFEFRGIEFESEAIIQYRLKGLSNEWKNIEANAPELEYYSLAPGDYQFEARIIYRNFQSEIQVYSFTVEVPFWQTWWFYSLLVLATASIVIIFFRIRLKRTKTKQRRQLDQQKMQTKMLDSELKALRSQMNPHFIFNSLNSIQDLVLREDKENSYDYIVLFAKLVRNTLNYSNMDFIPIEKELEFLDIYLSLEKLRFGDDFEYTIDYNGSKDVNVPSMLVQPFIENALVHGLIHKKGLKELKITFNRTKKLSCTITDNGVGRAKAKEIQQRQRGDHSSFALTAIEQRLELLNLQLGEEIGKYEVTDLYEDHQPIGTTVEINIPFRNQGTL